MKIAICCSPASEPFFKQAVAENNMTGRFVYWVYKDFSELSQLYLDGQEEVGGILFSGQLPLDYFQLNHPECRLPLLQVEDDLLLHASIRLINHQINCPEIPLNQVFCDFLGDVRSYTLYSSIIAPEQLPYTFLSSSIGDSFFRDLAHSVKSLYDQGKIKKAILSMSSLYNRLEAKGVPCELIPIAPENINKALLRIIEIVDGAANRQAGLALILLDYTHDDAVSSHPSESEYREATLAKVLVDYKRSLPPGLGMSIARDSNSIELVINIPPEQEIFQFVEGCLSYIQNEYPYPITAGIGIGAEAIGCRGFALSALKYARGFGMGFAFAQQGSILTGPLGQDCCLEIDTSLLSRTQEIAKGLGVNNLNYIRLLTMFSRTPVVTSEEVSEYLNITVRSASRILTQLTESGIVEQVDVPDKESRKGRPTNYFSLCNNVEIL